MTNPTPPPPPPPPPPPSEFVTLRELYPSHLALAPSQAEQDRASLVLARCPLTAAELFPYALGMVLAHVRMGASRGLMVALADELDRKMRTAGVRL